MTTPTNQHPDFPVALPGAREDNVRMWAQPYDVEPAALDQLRNISRLPWTHGVRVMPDVHLGKGATVGSVIAMRNAVAPAAVGVDIGCGMVAVRTDVTQSQLPDDLSAMRRAIEQAIPVGFSSHSGVAEVIRKDFVLRRRFGLLMDGFSGLRAEKIGEREKRASQQCGSLGGGNHFIEVTADEDGTVWLMLHSGSRNIGKEIAERHMYAARNLEHNLGLPDRDLAVFVSDTVEMENYLHDLYWAQDYALLNRSAMMTALKGVFARWFPQARFAEEIQAHHNYVSPETYDGVEVLVTRKGAISAQQGQYGLIPGSMGTGSYVVKGLGNTDSYCSASHGAGRRMSRTKAKKTFTLDDLAAQTAGVECRKDGGVLDEIPGAYKDLESVIAAQVDLVQVEARLTTLLCVKG
ncbi:MAG: RtcB family protein [Nocardioides sp.]